MRVVERQRRSDEGSAMVIAIIVVMIVTLLSTAMLARALSGLSSTRRSQDFQAALGKADSGVSDALFKIDQIGTGDADGACGADPPPCTISDVPDTMYTMEVLNQNTVRIKSRGTVNGVDHGVEAIAYRSLLYPFAIFGASLVRFDGDAEVISVAPPDPDVTTAIGTNGTLTCNPSNPAQSSFVYPPHGDGTGCDSEVGSGTYDPQPPVSGCPAPENTPSTPCVDPADPATNSCPVVGATSTLQNNIAEGTYLCTQAVVFPSNVTITGPVKLFVLADGSPQPITLDNTTVNAGGSAGDFLLYVDGAGDITTNGNHAFNFTGVLHAPEMEMTGNGCKATIFGSIVLASFDCNGGPNFDFTYDSSLYELLDEDWRIRDFEEIPSSSVTAL